MSRPSLLCTCGHDHAHHEHYRRGSDCGQCGPQACAAYTPTSRTAEPALVFSGAATQQRSDIA